MRAIPPQPSWIHGPARAWRDWHAAYDKAVPRGTAAVAAAREAMLASLAARLRSGELEATGIRLEPPSEHRPEPITPELWDILVLRPDRNEARARGIAYGGVRIRMVELGRVAERLVLGASTATASGSSNLKQPGNTVVARAPGRPSLLGAIRAELERRAQCGEMLEAWRPEARALAAWAQGEYPDDKAPMFESIERQLRDDYKQLRADRKPG